MTQVTQNKRLDGENDFVIICFSKRSRSPPSRLGGIGSKTFWPVILKIPSEKNFPPKLSISWTSETKKNTWHSIFVFFRLPRTILCQKNVKWTFSCWKKVKKCFFWTKKWKKKILAFQQIFVSTRLIETHLVEEFFCGDFFSRRRDVTGRSRRSRKSAGHDLQEVIKN